MTNNEYEREYERLNVTGESQVEKEWQDKALER